MTQEIKAGIGLDSLRFGMSKEEVENILGKPNEIDTHTDNNEDDGATESWHYDDQELSISFEEIDDFKLFSIAVSNKSYKFKNKKLIGLKKKELIEELEALAIDDLKTEDWSTDDNLGQELIFSEKLSINFWMEDGELSEIQWGPLLEDEGYIIWPE
ncbi:MAG: hypothetical protein PF489_01815 [Salinivirgaceae bacterium]|jgi:hypothetical protein|nr:hypothetical protein [Salinivirgaceae bacterium]